MIPGWVVLRYADYHPGADPLWHRTVMLEFGIVIEGEIELESGEKQLMKRGGVSGPGLAQHPPLLEEPEPDPVRSRALCRPRRKACRRQ